MTVQEAHLQFKAGVDKQDSLNSPNFTVEEIDLLLSDAQEQIIEQRAYGANTKGTSLEETQQRVKDLQSLTRNANISTFVQNADNKPTGIFVQLPQDYRHAIEEEITASTLDCNNQTVSTRIQVVPLMHTKYNKVMASPFSKPSGSKVYRLPFGRFGTPSNEYYEIILPVGYTLQTYHLRYIKNPLKLNLAGRTYIPGTPPFGLTNAADQLEMSDSICREVVRLAVRNALGDIESSRTQESIERLKEIE